MELQTAQASSNDYGVATFDSAQHTGGDTISLPWQQQQSNPEPRCSTIRRKTSRARLRYFNDMLSEDTLSVASCDTVRRRRQKSAAQWQRGTGLAAADETDSGIALTPEWELLPQAWSRATDERPAAAVESRRSQQAAVAGGPGLLLQVPQLKVPSASRWGDAFDTMVAQLRCKLPASASNAIDNDEDVIVARADSLLHSGSGDAQTADAQTTDSDAGCDGLSNGNSSGGGGCQGGDIDASRITAAHDRGGEQLWTGGGSSESGSCCSHCCAVIQCSHCHSSASSFGSERGGGVAGCQTTPVAFRDIIYRRTGRSLTIDIAPSIVKTASNNDVWVKLRNDQEDSSIINKSNSSASRRGLPSQQPLSRASQDASNRKNGAGDVKIAEQGSGRWQKLRKLFSVKANKKERPQGHVRVMLKNGGGHLD